jgi:hypothetical protein
VGRSDQNHRRNQNLPERPGQPYSPSAWKTNSPKFGCTILFGRFSYVRIEVLRGPAYIRHDNTCLYMALTD